MKLNSRDEQMLAGDDGPATAMAMRILVQLGEIQDAETLMDITQAHVDGCIYEGEANLEFALRLARLGGKVCVPTSLNATSLDLHNWQSWKVDPAFASKAQQLAQAYLDMGATPTWTCAPYQTSARPTFGQQIAWAESNAVVFVNSVVGARTNRYGDFTDICAALTGRVPYLGLHLTENRRAQILFELPPELPPGLLEDDAFYPVLGYYIGRRAAEYIPAISGLPSVVSEDNLKALGAGAASSGGVALFHCIGLTPEAPDLATACQGQPWLEVIKISLAELIQVREELSNTPDSTRLDAVILGSPHFSLAECLQLDRLLDGQQVHPDVLFMVTTNRLVKASLRAKGVLPKLEKAGVKLAEDTCILLSPMLGPEVKTMMTNSAKYAYYVPGLLERKVVFGSLQECVSSALAGKVVRRQEIWQI